MKEKTAYTPWRWMIACVLLLGCLILDSLWSAPSAILTEIMADLSVSLFAGGMLTSVLCLMITAVTPLYDKLSSRLSPKFIFAAGLFLAGLGQLLFFTAQSYGAALSFRALMGLGMGLCTPVYAVLIMENFPEKERPAINTVYSVLPYLATFISLYATVPLFHAAGDSWQKTLGLYGVAGLAVAVLFFLCLPVVASEKAEKKPGTKGVLREVAGMREVRLVCAADICDMWGYNFLSGFLPTYLQTEVGMSLERAAALTAIFPVAGIAAGLLCGSLMMRLGLRKPFTWPLHLMIFFGTLLIVFTGGPLRVLGIVMAGFGNAGWAPALYTMPMEFEGMTPIKSGAVFSLMLGLSYLAAFISPLLGGFIGDVLSLKAALTLNAFAALCAAVVTFCMKETGPKAKGAA